MNWVEYRCPTDGYRFFDAEEVLGTRVRSKCKRCRQVVEPEPKLGTVIQRTCRCSKCGRMQQLETPVDEQIYCLVCGTRTLWVVEEIRGPPTKDGGRRLVPAPVTSEER